jgi:hypothetical protein
MLDRAPCKWFRRRAGSRSAWCRWSASADTLAYLASDRTEVWPLLALSIASRCRVTGAAHDSGLRITMRVRPLPP